MSPARKLTCFQCGYFYITWEKNFPYGCKAMGFKSKKIPMKAVYENSGTECLSFSPKQRNAKPLRRQRKKKTGRT